jgi:alcohol dehydrogenase (cytochrome c)
MLGRQYSPIAVRITGSCCCLTWLLVAVLLLCAPVAAQRKTGTADVGWKAYNGTYEATRFSPLTEITADNVQSLIQVGRYELPETTSFQAGPLVIGDTMYVTTATSTYALEARKGTLRWSHKYTPKTLALNTPVRGVAYDQGRLYRGTPDAHVLALDAKSGKVVWDVPAGSAEKGEYFTSAPLVWQRRLFIGTSGSDVGSIGRMMALDTKDGKRLWNFNVVPSSGPGSETWPSDPSRNRAGGGIYSGYALDTASGMLYVPTGNPGPDFAPDYRPGANLYTCSVVRLDAKTGALRGFHQFTPHDFHDWDVAASPILLTSKAGTKMVVVGSKDGNLYSLNPELTSVAYKIPVTTIENVDAPMTPQGTRFCPGTAGGVNWYGPAYAPPANTIFVNSVDWCSTIKLGGPESLEFAPGKPFIGSSNAFGDGDAKKEGWLTAIDADTGKVLWKYHDPLPLVAGLLPTASGLVFTGDLAGNLLAFDGATGKLLFKDKAGGPVGGGVIAYSLGGQEYIAVAAGMENWIMQTKSGPASIVIYALRR